MNARQIALLLLAACLLLMPATSGETADKAGKIIEIRDKMFITQTDDIYINIKDYVGRTVRYEGIYTTFPPMPGEERQHMVFRNAPGCCGNDGVAGFMVAWDRDYPSPNDWVKVEGVLETLESGMPRVRLTALTVMEKRGQEFVTQ